MTISNQCSQNKNRIVISLGDPTGIGIEVILKALASEKLPSKMQPLLVGCKKTVETIYLQLESQGIRSLVNPKDLEIEDLPINEIIKPGQPNKQAGEASFQWLTHAANLLIQGQARALVTAPISKHFWHQAGHIYPGQTERLAEIAGTNNPSMLFTAISPINNWRFNTLLATTHIPLQEVHRKLNSQLINTKLNTLLTFCKRFKDTPRIAVAGLNPHAGEAGKIGTEEIQWLIPLLKEWQAKHPEIKLDGPMPPDTCWLSAAKAWQKVPSSESPDGILALYHDQGLIPMKLIAFDQAVNTTLGLPFIRTSPDHGTAFNIAGKGVADAHSMLAALKASWDLTEEKG
ncbi:4-hydroxythreonine-4-phosphate dehydrogenase PdxA [Prochlorococcus sp. MIT 1307]|uniref:4-hydroxythreonine-4-phosphate dehydrogenase PdxA n=1 Tax=Prochlorococcus sp. MIT 1307 TaxID=3096219 RepID=UPI002A75DC07|nr:4-hydroxythreonine-4-phosphate dehydrogenase PdxA [Prochlorococcus sp. MIT 1307]